MLLEATAVDSDSQSSSDELDSLSQEAAVGYTSMSCASKPKKPKKEKVKEKNMLQKTAFAS